MPKIWRRNDETISLLLFQFGTYLSAHLRDVHAIEFSAKMCLITGTVSGTVDDAQYN